MHIWAEQFQSYTHKCRDTVEEYKKGGEMDRENFIGKVA